MTTNLLESAEHALRFSASPEEQQVAGKGLRLRLEREAHGKWQPTPARTDPISILQAADANRLQNLVPIRYGRMLASPFAFYRGSAGIMASDLAMGPKTGWNVQACGDCHLANFGGFATPERNIVFDINDFDETIRGPFEWDLKRMAASLILAGRESRHKESSARDAVHHCIMRYCDQMRAFAKMPLLEVGRFQVHRLGDVEPVHAALLKAERATPVHNLEQLTEPVPGKPGIRRFKEIEPNLTRLTGSQAEKVLNALGPYREMLELQRQHLLSLYRPIDVAFKVVGTGSVGLRDYCIYFEGNGSQDPLFLQIKEEAPSAYAPYLPNAHPSPHNGQRVVIGQRAMQLQSDPFLGWTHIGTRHFLVRQLNDHKGSIDLSDLAGTGLAAFGEVCGELLARGHARSGDPLVIAGYLGNGDTFAEALAKFGALYANQTEKDWQALRRSGRVQPR